MATHGPTLDDVPRLGTDWLEERHYERPRWDRDAVEIRQCRIIATNQATTHSHPMVRVTSDTQFVGSHSGELVMPRARSVNPTTPATRNPTPRHEEVSSTSRTHREEMGHAKARQTIATTSPMAAFPHCAAAGLSKAWLTSGLT